MTQIRKMTVATTTAKQNRANPIIAELYELLDFLRVPHSELARVFPAVAKEEPDA